LDSPIYRLSDELQESPAGVGIGVPDPSEADREELVLKKIGVKGWGRLHHFRNYYSQGWGEHGGKPLSPRALEAFYRFIEVLPPANGHKPRLFLTDDGNLELCWDDPEGKSIQVEFTASRIEYYIESTNREGHVGFDGLTELALRLMQR
jgi:hypothetical protein